MASSIIITSHTPLCQSSAIRYEMRRIAHELRRYRADYTRNRKDRQIDDRRIADQCRQSLFLGGSRSGIEIDSNIRRIAKKDRNRQEF